ncbi:MAG: S-glutathionyl-(chloro)hydroquinone reductase [Cirrosporium novae-zelandiae]|nr:MAG: S-glutathionyl-(chloro)hydroquinone reductase [Cirrosporium novae-zelandiae]KAI9735498.1 MAG: S-glutathionyl-(chloro)hydroquinone reductase [Cirrosporium novae-zelandiae]
MAVRITPFLVSVVTVAFLGLYLNHFQTSVIKKITDWVDPKDKSGEFKRQTSSFRSFISREAGAEFPPEKDRYHLYVSYACPWGWRFATPDEHVPGENVTPDPLHPSFTHLREIYFEANPNYDGRFTVPVLYDKKTKKIVNNESSEIIRMFYYEFDDLIDEKYKQLDLYPEDLRKEIDETNDWTYNDINNGVYKCGFATTQEAYEKALQPLFHALAKAEHHLLLKANPDTPFYLGTSHPTEVDIRLYTTIIRFDPVYVQHFKTNLKDIRSGFPALHRWLRMCYWDLEAFSGTTQFEHIKKHYTKSHKQINQFSITPVGPLPNIMGKDEEVMAAKAMQHHHL